MTEFKGGCLCGKVRFELTQEPMATMVCHCTSCQKSTGTAFSVVSIVPDSAVKMTGEIKTYADTSADSGNAVNRSFCPSCGSPVITTAAVMPGIAIIKAGTFDDTSWLKPSAEIYCSSTQPWVKHADGAVQHARMPG